MEKTIDELLQSPCYVIDILPKQVPAQGPGQFFAVEKYFLEPQRLYEIKEKHVRVLLKLNCYRRISVDGAANPPPERLSLAVHGRSLCLRVDDALILSEPDDTHLSVFGPDAQLLSLLEAISSAEGLFLWQPSGGAL